MGDTEATVVAIANGAGRQPALLTDFNVLALEEHQRSRWYAILMPAMGIIWEGPAESITGQDLPRYLLSNFSTTRCFEF